MKTQTKVTTALAISFGISVLGGMFSWNIPDGVNIILGTVDIVCIVWLMIIAYSTENFPNK